MSSRIYRKIRGGIKYVFDSNYRMLYNAGVGKYDDMPDEDYLKKFFKAKTGRELNLDNPRTFNEKLQWLKIHDRNPLYTQMVDKYGVREYVGRKIGNEYVIPLLGVWDNPDEVNIENLPNQFVLKTTHGCGGMCICRDKKSFNINKAKAQLNRTFNRNYYYYVREWPYKNVRPRVIAEKYMQDGDELNLKVYKVFNFNGQPKIIQAIQNDKTADESIDYYDTDWNLLDLRQNFPNSKVPTLKPETLNKMIELSAICSQGFPFLRTDWYEVNGKVFFSEFTFYSDSGMELFHPDKWDQILGSWIDISAVKV